MGLSLTTRPARRRKTDALLRVLHLDDHPADAALVAEALEHAGYEAAVTRVAGESAFRRALAEGEYDVVLGDHAPGHHAIAALRTVRGARPALPFIIVCRTIEPHAAVVALREGAEDIVLKDDLRRLAPSVREALELRAGLAKLSPRQQEVLVRVALGQTTRRIADALGISVKTVDTHRGALMKRLGLHDVASLVRYAVRVGLLPPLPK